MLIWSEVQTPRPRRAAPDFRAGKDEVHNIIRKALDGLAEAAWTRADGFAAVLAGDAIARLCARHDSSEAGAMQLESALVGSARPRIHGTGGIVNFDDVPPG
jgi:hypothetical protein